MSRVRTLRSSRKWVLIVFSVFMLAAVACAADASGGSSAEGASQPVGSTSDEAGQNAGLNEACVQQVLGRQATGFADITAAERDAIFEQCSGDEQEQRTRQFTADGAGNLLENLDQDCVTRITGSEDLDFTQLGIEERQQVFTECLPEGFLGARDGSGTGGFTGGGFAAIDELLQGCVTEALGETPESLFSLTPEQTEAVAAACGDQFADGFGGGFRRSGEGFPGIDGEGTFGGGDRFLGGREGGGGFTRVDLSSECVTNLLGHTVTGPGDITPEEFQQIFANCS